jgi:threonyl-tRNA synthetase
MLPVEAEVKIKDLGVVGEIRVHAVEEMAVAPRRVRIYGAVFESKEEKKEFAKNKAGVIPSSHVVIGRQRKWYEEIDEGRWIWYPSGYKIRSILLHFFEKMASEEGFSWMSIERDCQYFSLDKSFSLHKSVAVRCAQEIVSECVITSEPESKTFSSGLLDTYFKHKHISHIFCEKGNLLEKTISCLHFVTKIFKILGFAFQIVLVGKQKRGVFEAEVLVDALAKSGVAFTTENVLNQPLSIEWRIQDKMGIYWPVSAIYCPRKCNLKQQEYAVLPFSLFLSIERVLALLIESTKGKLPSFLAPYQVTVLVVREKHVEYAKDVVLQLTLAGVRAQIILKGELKANLHQACIEGVPYIAVVGDKEVANRTIALRVEEGAPPLCVTLDELVKMCNHGCKQE